MKSWLFNDAEIPNEVMAIGLGYFPSHRFGGQSTDDMQKHKL